MLRRQKGIEFVAVSEATGRLLGSKYCSHLQPQVSPTGLPVKLIYEQQPAPWRVEEHVASFATSPAVGCSPRGSSKKPFKNLPRHRRGERAVPPDQ